MRSISPNRNKIATDTIKNYPQNKKHDRIFLQSSMTDIKESVEKRQIPVILTICI
ncbi:hypothetical protein [Campylobacter molothri]|uniref:hypothetical protein n=1 Tax=Campylobacter molothri TaxID=1032242 RepID=UPI00301CFC93|nr:hypothetical protein [Campylobacter sp. RM10542]